MRRKLFNLAALLSLVLCVGTIVFTAARSIREPRLYEIEIRDDSVAMHSLILIGLIPTFLILPIVWGILRSKQLDRRRGFAPLVRDEIENK